MFVFGLSLLSFAHCATIVCDVLIAGGSTASLAAALASARHGADTCLTDPTDWLGGQLTASAVSAIDFGWANNPSNTSFGWSNLPRSFRELLRVLSVDQRCWVSSMCYRPIHLLSFIDTVVRNTTNLRVFRSAVVVAVQSRASLVTSVQVVQRTAKSNTTGYEHLLSDQLADWYSASDSSFFTKVTLSFQARVFVDATEFGDVIGNLGKSVQGMESPDEDSQAYLSQCGQSHTVGFFIRALQPGSVCAGAPVPPGCKNCTGSFTFGPWRWDQSGHTGRFSPPAGRRSSKSVTWTCRTGHRWIRRGFFSARHRLRARGRAALISRLCGKANSDPLRSSIGFCRNSQRQSMQRCASTASRQVRRLVWRKCRTCATRAGLARGSSAFASHETTWWAW